MILLGTKLVTADNSGALVVKCIKIIGCSYSNHTNIGDTIIVSVQNSISNKKVSKHDVLKSIVIRQRSRTSRTNGMSISFLKNSVVVVKKNNEPIGSRIIGCTMQELRFKKCVKIMLLSSKII